MTFQPPPPGGNPPAPPPPPPGQWGPPPGGPAGPGGQLRPEDGQPARLGHLLGIGLLVFIFSFIDWYTVRLRTASAVRCSEWRLARLLRLVRRSVRHRRDCARRRWSCSCRHSNCRSRTASAALGLYAVALLCVILAHLRHPRRPRHRTFPAASKGHGFGFWVSLILVTRGSRGLARCGCSRPGRQLPGPLAGLPNIGSKGPQGGIGGGHGGGRPGPGPGPGPGALRRPATDRRSRARLNPSRQNCDGTPTGVPSQSVNGQVRGGRAGPTIGSLPLPTHGMRAKGAGR